MSGAVESSEPGSRVVAFVLSRRFVVLFAAAMALYVFGWATKWTFDPWAIGRFWPGHFYSAQADAMLHGRLWVDRSNLPGECFVEDGHCYGYFGIVPSLLRIPLVMVLGVRDAELTPLFLAVAAGIAMWATLDLCRRVLVRAVPTGGRAAAWYLAIAAVVLGPGSVLVLLTDPYVYQEAILWSIAGSIVAIDLFWRWWTEQRRWQFAGAVVALVFAAGARPTAVFVGVVLAIGVVVARWIAIRLTWRVVIGAVALALLPAVFSGAVLFAKFGSLTQPFADYEARHSPNFEYLVRNMGDEKMTHYRFIPTTMYAYFRPDTVRLTSEWPWVRFRFGWPFGPQPLERITFLPPLATDSIYAEKTVSLTDIMPLAMVATGAAVVLAIRRRRGYELLILASLGTSVLVMAASATVTSRYLGDIYPLVAVGTAFAAGLVPWYSRRGRATRTVIAVPVVALTALSVVVVASLATTYDWIYFLGIQ